MSTFVSVVFALAACTTTDGNVAPSDLDAGTATDVVILDGVADDRVQADATPANDGAPGGVGCLAQFGDRARDFATSHSVDASGNVVVSGVFQGNIGFGGGVISSLGGEIEWFVAKLTRDCKHVFSRSVGRAPPLVDVDANGDVFLLGRTGSNPKVERIDFGFGVPPADSVILVKMSASGIPQWQKTLETSAQSLITLLSFQVVGAGGFLISGAYGPGPVSFGGGPSLPSATQGPDGTNQRQNGFVAKVDSLGGHVFSFGTGLPISGNDGLRATTNASGAILIDGSCLGGGQLNLPGGAFSCPTSQFFAAKINAAGTATSWIRYSPERIGLRPLNSGDLILVTTTSVARIPDAPSGAVWTRTLFPNGEGNITSVFVTSTDDVVIGGSTKSMVDFGGGATTQAVGGFFARYTSANQYKTSAVFRNVFTRSTLVDPVSDEVILIGDGTDRFDLGTGILRSRWRRESDVIFVRRPNTMAPDPGPSPPDVAVGQPLTIGVVPQGFEGVYQIATNGSLVYVSAVAKVFSCPISGCNGNVTVVKSFASPVATIACLRSEANAVAFIELGFWVNSLEGGLYCPWSIGGCAEHRSDYAEGGLAIDATRVFWSLKMSPPTTPSVRTMVSCVRGADCSQPTQLLSNAAPLASDGTTLLWVGPDPDATSGSSVYACPVAGCTTTPTKILPGISNALSRAASGSSFVVPGEGGALLLCSFAGCGMTPTILATGNGFAMDATNVYFTHGDGGSSLAGSLLKCPLTGCPDTGPTVLATGQVFDSGLAVDNLNVYWIHNAPTNQPEIRRIAK